MPRPTRSPAGKAIRLTVYVTPDTAEALLQYAAATYSSPGEIVDKVVNDFLINPVAPKLSDARASLPSLAGQPGVEHRAAAGPANPAVVRTIETVDMRNGSVIASVPFYDHPGWKLSATGQNVCIRCGKTKIRSKNASCKAPA